MNLKNLAAVFCVIVCSISEENLVAGQGNYSCIRYKEEFDKYWLLDTENLKWAMDSSQLPKEFIEKLVGQDEDVFYFEYPAPDYINAVVFEFPLENHPTYVYIKYYAHRVTPDALFALKDAFLADNLYLLDTRSDYIWKEALFEVSPVYAPPQLFVVAYLEQLDNFFVDTIIYAAGKKYNVATDLDDVRSLCPPRILPTTTTTTTTEPPPNPYFNCINTKEDFEKLSWLSRPSYKYAIDSSDLPQTVRNLEGNGIFYLEGPTSSDNMLFYKLYTDDPDWEDISKYLYIKYYAHTVSNKSQTVYARPVYDANSGFHMQVLPPGKEFRWEEVIVQIENVQNEPNMEIGTLNFQAGEYFLIDKIEVARSNSYSEAVHYFQKCIDT